MNEYVEQYSSQYGIPKQLIKAIIEIESGGNPFATRYEPNYVWTYRVDDFAEEKMVTKDTELICQKTSWGLMQVMGAVAREKGFNERFLSKLVDPEYGLKYGCKHLKDFYKRYEDWTDAISSYNQGSPRKDDNGDYKNQEYVDKVLRNWK